MKRIFNITSLLLLALCGVFSSCDKEDPFTGPDGQGSGTANFRKMLVEVKNEEVVKAAAVDVNTFLVTITDDRSGDVAWSGTYADLPEVLSLPVGNYTVKVNSPENPDADWDKPYFEGTQTFSITEDDITTVDPVVCKLSNVKVTVIFDDKLRAVLGDDVKVTVVACDNGRLEFTPSETRSGYFKYIGKEGNSATMVATFTGTVDENYEENFRTYTEVAPGNHYKITYTLKGVEPDVPEQTGTITPGVYVDSYVEDVNLTIDLDVPDDPLDPDRPGEDPDNPDNPDNPDQGEKPTLTLTPGLSFETPNTVTDGMVAVVTVHSSAAGGLTSFTVDIDSNTLTPEELQGVGLTSHLDLVNPGQFATALADLGFPVNVGGQTDPAPMVLTDFLPLLSGLGPGTHNFILKVGDANGVTTKTLTFITL